REIYLSVLHDMEAPPNPRVCIKCGGDDMFRCTECAYRPVLCSMFCIEVHQLNPFHKIERWAGTSLRTTLLDCLQYLKVGFIMHLGHGGKPCPCGGYPGCNISPSMEDEWEDMDTAGHPPHLARPEGHSCLTIVNVNGVHYCNIWYCNCNGTEGSQLQLLRAGLFPATMRDCRTSFTFHVLDDFLQDNVECGTSTMNYYSKIQRMTSSTFPHLVPDRYRELLRVSRAWRNLKLLKWKGFYPRSCYLDHGGLVLFCPACPQPGINIPEMDDQSPYNNSWKYSRVIVMDSNFKVEHMVPKHASNETWLMDGQGYMVASQDYKTYLGGTTNKIMHSDCNNHHAISQTNHHRGQLASTGIGECACARHGCFIAHSMVDFQMGEQQVNMDYALVHVLHHEMKPSHRVLHFYDINCQYSQNLECMSQTTSTSRLHVGLTPAIVGALQKKYKAAQKHEVATEEAFTSLNDTLPNELQEQWEQEEQAAFAKRTDDPRAMDIFDVQLQKAPTIKSIEIDLICAPKLAGHPWGSATWIACGLSIEEAQVSLACESRHNIFGDIEAQRLMISCQRDRLLSCINRFVQSSVKFISCDWNDHMDVVNYSKGLDYQVDPDALEAMELPLPSYLGAAKCQELGGQANDALHQLRLALADKSQLYHKDVFHARNYTMTSQAWKKVSDMDALVNRYTMVYQKCRNQMVSLRADGPILEHYQALEPEHLNVTTMVANPNACRHRHKHLAWCWTMDIPKDTCTNDWISEFHWLRAKSQRDRCCKEVELLQCEMSWTKNFFLHQANHWQALNQL
ncbi:hypothetical protein EDC04DRAFT_2510232, partial [Pisolithus marmoratus]